MLGNPELVRLNSRKAALLAQSDALRRALLADCVQLRPVVSWVETGTAFIRRIKPLLVVIAPLLGFWVARKRGLSSGLTKKLSAGWRLWRVIAAMRRGSRSG